MSAESGSAEDRFLAEQLGHTLDLVKAEISALKAEQAHQDELSCLRLDNLERQAADFENRLRELSESATQFKFLVSLAVGGGLLSLVALLRTLVGP
jgi:hypothetical protein